MGNDNSQATSRHHYVQKAYLDKFADNKKIDVVNRITGEVRYSQATYDVANMRGLYTGVNKEGKKDGGLEGAFATDIESPAIKIINNMTCIFPFVPFGRDRAVIASYIALQSVRTLEAKRKFETQFGTVTAIEMFNLANNPGKIKKYLRSINHEFSKKAVIKFQQLLMDRVDNLEVIPHNNSWLKHIEMAINYIPQILVERYTWHLIYYDKPTFVTSDSPVSLRKVWNDHSGVGFANADEIMFPLGIHHALLLSIENEFPESVLYNPERKTAEIINHYTITGSYLEFYCPPILTNQFSGKPLGQRAITEMSGSLEGTEFLQKYVGVLDRVRPNR